MPSRPRPPRWTCSWWASLRAVDDDVLVEVGRLGLEALEAADVAAGVADGDGEPPEHARLVDHPDAEPDASTRGWEYRPWPDTTEPRSTGREPGRSEAPAAAVEPEPASRSPPGHREAASATRTRRLPLHHRDRGPVPTAGSTIVPDETTGIDRLGPTRTTAAASSDRRPPSIVSSVMTPCRREAGPAPAATAGDPWSFASLRIVGTSGATPCGRPRQRAVRRRIGADGEPPMARGDLRNRWPALHRPSAARADQGVEHAGCFESSEPGPLATFGSDLSVDSSPGFERGVNGQAEWAHEVGDERRLIDELDLRYPRGHRRPDRSATPGDRPRPELDGRLTVPRARPRRSCRCRG